jgi:hypothetical protein
MRDHYNAKGKSSTMEVRNERKSTFSTKYYAKSGCMVLKLNEDFNFDDWLNVETVYRKKIEQGILYWDLDIRRLRFVNSFFLGHALSLNAYLANHKGTLRIMVEKDSKIASLLYMSKINQIVKICEI